MILPTVSSAACTVPTPTLLTLFLFAIASGCSPNANGPKPSAASDAHTKVDASKAETRAPVHGAVARSLEITVSPTMRTLVGNAVLTAAAGSLSDPTTRSNLLQYFPDEGTSILSRASGSISLLIAGGSSSWLLSGTSLTSLTSAQRVLVPTTGSWDNGYAGMSAVVSDDNGTLWGFYHGEDHVGLPNLPGTSIPGFYARIGLASSNDGGRTWTKLGYVIESHVPKHTTGDGAAFHADQGAGEPGALWSADGRWLYLYYSDHSRDGRPVVECMARAAKRDLSPTVANVHTIFSKYTTGSNGCTAGGAGTFSGAAIGGPESPIMKNPVNCDLLEGHVTYSATLGRYIMVLTRYDWTDPSSSTSPKNSGLSITTSTDGINWDDPSRIVTEWPLPTTGKPLSWQASILWNPGSDTEGTLVYGYTQSWPNPPHYMASRAISFSLR